MSPYGPGFPLRPVSMLIIAFILLGMNYKTLAKLWQRNRG